MKDLFIAVCIGEVVLIALLVIRVARGASVTDRIVAVNTMSTQAAIAVLFFGAFAGRTVFIDTAIWLASFSYLGGIVWARYLERGLL
jgi:multicomponent Na+:H+ antiporter subunit F